MSTATTELLLTLLRLLTMTTRLSADLLAALLAFVRSLLSALGQSLAARPPTCLDSIYCLPRDHPCPRTSACPRFCVRAVDIVRLGAEPSQTRKRASPDRPTLTAGTAWRTDTSVPPHHKQTGDMPSAPRLLAILAAACLAAGGTFAESEDRVRTYLLLAGPTMITHPRSSIHIPH